MIAAVVLAIQNWASQTKAVPEIKTTKSSTTFDRRQGSGDLRVLVCGPHTLYYSHGSCQTSAQSWEDTEVDGRYDRKCRFDARIRSTRYGTVK